MGNVMYRMGPLGTAFEEAKEKLVEVDAGRRLWERDASLWTATDENRWLAWLDAPLRAVEWAAEAHPLAEEARSQGVSDVLLLGMGGSSLCPEVLASTFGKLGPAPRLSVLDSTVPDQVLRVEAGIDLDRAWFVVASKSGSTTEPNAFLEYFYDRSGRDGSRFISITDPGSSLESLAKERRFRHVFYGDPEIGGRFSALSHFGLVPAALAGIDLEQFLVAARSMCADCGPSVPTEANPGLTLGAAMGAAAGAGRNKLTLQLSSSIAHLGAWVEQLVAESTGKHQVGICPIVDEPELPAMSYGADRVFILVSSGADPSIIERADKLEAAGHPVIVVSMDGIWDLSGEFYRWEVATAAAGVLFGINPFDQPNVQESKDITAALISDYVSSGSLPDERPSVIDGALSLYTNEAIGDDRSVSDVFREYLGDVAQPDYIGLCAFVDMRPDVEDALQEIRRLVSERLQVATTLGFGPRFLHSTGQLHKGGPNSGVFIHITCEPTQDASVPGLGYTFDALSRAQALGDVRALAGRGRRVLRCHVTEIHSGLRQLRDEIRQALPA